MSNSKTKHTPGPWHFIDVSPANSSRKAVSYLCNKTPHLHAVVEGLSDADARLIAAAPDLLAALIEATEILRRFGGIPGDPFKYDKLIAKATGGEA
jgi:hypothetical protein